MTICSSFTHFTHNFTCGEREIIVIPNADKNFGIRGLKVGETGIPGTLSFMISWPKPTDHTFNFVEKTANMIIK